MKNVRITKQLLWFLESVIRFSYPTLLNNNALENQDSQGFLPFEGWFKECGINIQIQIYKKWNFQRKLPKGMYFQKFQLLELH